MRRKKSSFWTFYKIIKFGKLEKGKINPRNVIFLLLLLLSLALGFLTSCSRFPQTQTKMECCLFNNTLTPYQFNLLDSRAAKFGGAFPHLVPYPHFLQGRILAVSKTVVLVPLSYINAASVTPSTINILGLHSLLVCYKLLV